MGICWLEPFVGSEEMRKRRRESQSQGAPEDGRMGAEEEEQFAVVEPSVKHETTGNKTRYFYAAMNSSEEQIRIHDPVLVVAPGNNNPFVGLIMEIFRDMSSDVVGPTRIKLLWLYRPEEALKKDRMTHFKAEDVHVLYFSDHTDVIDSTSIMHSCVIHFIPHDRGLPDFDVHPGFVVQYTYCTMQKQLFSITDTDFRNKIAVLRELVEKSRPVWETLPIIVNDSKKQEKEPDAVPRITPKMKPQDSKRFSKWNSGAVGDMTMAANSPASDTGTPKNLNFNDELNLLEKLGFTTGNKMRDRSRGSLLSNVKIMLQENMEEENYQKLAAEAASALEDVAFKKFGLENKKYTMKIRTLGQSFKSFKKLTFRFVHKELTPELVLSFDPDELRDGAPASEKQEAKNETPEMMEWTDAICSSCDAKKVAIKDILSTGNMLKYMLECQQCGHKYASSMDQITRLIAPPTEPPATLNQIPAQKSGTS